MTLPKQKADAATNLPTHAKPRRSSTTSKFCRQLGILFGDLNLSARGLSVGECVDNLAFSTSQLGGSFKVLESFGYLVLLQQELGHGCNGNVTLWVN